MNRLQYLLNKLSEEASEIVQISQKTAQFGLNEVYDDGKNNLSNRERCHAEIDDLLGIISLLNDEFDFCYEPDREKIEQKKDKTNRYYKYSKELGMVSDE